ncbi:TetR/AcrR family transcriptional regulator [Nocardia stercoris]|uniref:TetR/AcrR family transcriptional regulator n=1 Tax=Nocardia stercoris TaxID=2483361 RepID=UPI001F402413|nr:TetR/AcrR family transcriptional regulator [Nocardia stercoris]
MTGQRTYGGVSADERRAQRRAALLSAALEIIGTQGLEKLTVAGLCAEAGLNERYYYEQFDSRDAVLTALFDEIATELAAAVTRDVSQTRGDTRATARAAIAAGIGVLTDDPRKARVALIISAATPQLRARTAATNTAFAALVATQGVDFFGLGAAEANPAISFRATYLVGGLVQALTSWLHGDLPMTRDELVEHITDVFVLLGEDLVHPRD